MTNELCFKTATELAALVRNGEITAVELMEAHLQQIEVVNPKVNAIITLIAEQAIDGAKAADAKQAKGELLATSFQQPVIPQFRCPVVLQMMACLWASKLWGVIKVNFPFCKLPTHFKKQQKWEIYGLN